ncbi:DinB family protein [Microtetraspora glauca]|uniref:DinB family protein n=1 Tax=Microtetraspora glauca TaxID=1996 RepID=A0ABV3GJJ1_MICGL
MTETDPKADLHHYLQDARDALLWKLEGLSEYDIRRPMTPTGTNLLGLVKHLTTVELLYFSYAFDRPFVDPPSWFRQDAEPNEDLWATAEESRAYIVETYRRACAHSDGTIDALGLDAVGHLPWWPAERGATTLHRVLVHVIAECHRHAGHADIVRESIDAVVGLQDGNAFMAPGDRTWWEDYRNRLERVAQEAGRS